MNHFWTDDEGRQFPFQIAKELEQKIPEEDRVRRVSIPFDTECFEFSLWWFEAIEYILRFYFIQFTVGRRGVYDIPMQVDEAGAGLRIAFETDNHDISFGIFRRTDKGEQNISIDL